MVKKYLAVDKRIIELLRDHPGLCMSTHQIRMSVGGNPSENWTRKWLKDLVDKGLIYRRPGPGHSYLYSISKSSKIYQANPIKPQIVVEKEINRVEVTPSNVRSLLKTWSENQWNPKIFESAKFLPLSIARLFELAHEISYGGAITKQDLNTVYKDLEEFKKDLTSTYTTLVSLMETPNLWDPHKFVKFLLEGGAPVDLLRDQALELKEKYKK